MLTATAMDFQTRELGVYLGSASSDPIRVVLEIASLRSTVTITASRGMVEQIADANQVVAAKEKVDLLAQALPTIGHVLEGNPGIMIQETTRGQVSPYLRGLTGYQTLLLIDGVRLNTSTFRSGPNQYLAFIQPSQVERVEAVLGPTGTTYGSDSLGGTINVITVDPRLGHGSRWESHAEVASSGAMADLSGATSAQVSLGNQRIALLLAGNIQRCNDLRTGGGEDSRDAFRRYLGLTPSQVRGLLGERLIGTAFTEYGSHAKLAIRPRSDQSLTLWYAHTALEGVRSYRDQIGGVGRVLSRSTPQGLDFVYSRYEKLRVGFLDSLSGTFSLNSQKDGTTRGGIRFSDTVTVDRSKVDSFGYTAQGTTHLGSRNTLVFGGEVYDERVFSTRFSLSPVLNTMTQDRAQYPDNSRYWNSGLFIQDASEFLHGKLRAVMGLRFSDIGFHSFADRNRTAEGRLLGVADSLRDFRDVTFNSSLAWHVSRVLSVHALVGRGFRAPNLTDLGSIGVTTLGYDIPIEEVLPLRPLMGADSSEGSVSTGKMAQRLGPESLFNYETGASLQTRKLYARLHVFDAELLNPIASRTLLFPMDSVPTSIAGIPVRPLPPTPAQLQQGVTAVVTNLSSRAVKASVNDGHARYYGLESLFQYQVSSRWSLQGNYAFLTGRDLNPNRPVRRLPPQQGMASVRYVPSGRRMWLDLGCRFAGPQNRLAGGDLDDDRMGATRSRKDIADFFSAGMASAFIMPGPDGKRGTADDAFSATGETVAAIRDRVLPIGSTINGVRVLDDNTRVPLFVRTDGWWSADLRGGVPLGEMLTLRFGISNFIDKNFRVHGSGIDAPGRDLFVGFRYAF